MPTAREADGAHAPSCGSDTQVRIDDEYLLLSKGDVPKEVWINPRGGHLGRQVGAWPDPLIFKRVIIPWLVKTLAAPAN